MPSQTPTKESEKSSNEKSNGFFDSTNWTASLVLLAGVIVVGGLFLIWPYQDFEQRDGSYLEESLQIFSYNESKHFIDPVPGCWYDSGDYIVFTQRNAKVLYYLSLAYSEAKSKAARNQLRNVINDQLACFDELIDRNIKQIRDQRSHTVILPPLLNQMFTPQPVYNFNESEGRDVYALRALIAENLGNHQAAEFWAEMALDKERITISENCCEEGPIQLSEKDMGSLEYLAGMSDRFEHPGGWGIDFSNLALLKAGDTFKIKDILEVVRDEWDAKSPKQFDYIGGNYDIAGTIALERLYYQKTGDDEFRQLSDSLFAYLHGVNYFDVNFTSYPKPHHPCGQWWATCELDETLINGIDEQLVFDTSRWDDWRLTEIQLPGQAEYVLTLVLYLGL